MNNRTIAIIVTVLSVILCGCPGLFSLCIGSTAALIGLTGDPKYYIGLGADYREALVSGLFMICLSIILIAIPFVVGLLLLRGDAKIPKENAVSNKEEDLELITSKSPNLLEKSEYVEEDIPPAI
jgi:hypothetical protein